MMETPIISLGQLLNVIGVLVALVALLAWWKADGRDKALDAKIEGIARALDARVEGIGKTLDAKIACVQEAVATGAEEHKAWREELDKTNKRLDDEFANTNKRLDGLFLHLMGRDNAK